MNDRKLFKCYDPRFFALSLIAALAMIGAALLEKRFETGSAPRLAFAVVQAVAFGSIIVGSVVVIRRLDELQHRIHLEALALAFGATGAIITGWGFLEKAGAPSIEWSLWVWPVMVAFWMVGLLIVRRRYA